MINTFLGVTRNNKKVFIVLAILIGLLMPFLSLDYGMTEDARVHHEHGKRILDYYRGVDETAALSPISTNGELINISLSEENLKKGMNGFGGFFDLLCNFLYQYFSFVGEYEFRNVISAILGFLLFLFCGLLGKELGGWKTGLITLIFVSLIPVLFGQAMNSPKDLPFAAFYIFSVFHLIKLLKELPVVSIKRTFFLVLNISILINIRLIGLVFFGYLFLFVFVWWFLENYKEGFKKIQVKQTLLLMAKVISIAVLSYVAIGVFWPYIQTSPIKGPIELFFVGKDYKGFVSTQIFEGVWRTSYDMPWYYSFKSLLYIAMPLHILLGMLLIPLVYVKTNKKELLVPTLILFTSLFPLLLMILGNANSYDHSRHFLFTVAPMVIIVAYTWSTIIGYITNKRLKIVAILGVVLLMLQPLYFMVKNHPFQALYFSPIIGGVSGAYGNYEIDYLGYGIKPAIEWLEKHVDSTSDKPARVRMYYGEQLKARYYLDKTPHLSYVLTREDKPNWDYGIVMLTEAKFDKNLEKNWPPKNTIHQVEVDNIPICYVVENDFKSNDVKYWETLMKTKPSVYGYIELSLLYYNQADYFNSIKASKKVIGLDANNSIAYSNLCSAYNKLMMYNKAKTAGENAAKLSPNMNIAINNLKISKKGVDKRENKQFSLKEYLTLSYNYYKLGEYQECILLSYELLEVFPNNSTAYNNICSSFNQLEKYTNAVDACEKALRLSPNFERAKNNLKYAKSKLK